tara:strand:+ start:24220 stop:24720 length:501 start_codon:yes stop_codon:yes gene_type:complete
MSLNVLHSEVRALAHGKHPTTLDILLRNASSRLWSSVIPTMYRKVIFESSHGATARVRFAYSLPKEEEWIIGKCDVPLAINKVDETHITMESYPIRVKLRSKSRLQTHLLSLKFDWETAFMAAGFESLETLFAYRTDTDQIPATTIREFRPIIDSPATPVSNSYES